MRAFRGFAIFLALVLIALGIFILYDSLTQKVAAAPGQIIAGAVLCSLALALLYFVSRPALK